MLKHLAIAGLVIAFSVSGCSILNGLNDVPPPVEFMFVGPEMVNCDNPQRENLCLQIKQREDAPWELYTGRITGLPYTPGFIYALQVQAERNSGLSSPAETNWVLYKMMGATPVPKSTDVAIDIRNGAWTLYEFVHSGQTVKATGEPLPRVNFSLDYHISGTTGCNNFTGIYSIDAAHIKFDAVSTSKSLCSEADGRLEQEQTILYTLRKKAGFNLSDGNLTISSDDNTTQLIYRR